MIYLDANVIIRYLEGDISSRESIDLRLANESVVISSTLSRLECRCHPIRKNNPGILQLYDDFFSAADVLLVQIDTRVIDEATQIRAYDGFTAPDAIHLASAVVAGVKVFLTGDTQLARCTRLTVEII